MMTRRLTALLAFLAVTSVTGVVCAETLVAIEGRVIDARDGSPVAKAEVVLRQGSTATLADGTFALLKLAPSSPVSFRAHRLLQADAKALDPKQERYEYFDQTVPTTFALLWVNAEIEEVSGSQRRTVPAFGWKIIDLAAPRGNLEIQVSAKDPKGEFCRTCHPENDYVEKITVKAEKPWPVPVTEQFFSGHRFRDLHPTGYDHGKVATARAPRFVVAPQGIELLDGKTTTCFSCHTPHRPTPFRAFVKGEYEVKGEFCRRCHR
jgi:hypothetical protein